MLGNPAKLSVFSHVPQTAFNLLYLLRYLPQCKISGRTENLAWPVFSVKCQLSQRRRAGNAGFGSCQALAMGRAQQGTIQFAGKETLRDQGMDVA